jgi:hypothetical protein
VDPKPLELEEDAEPASREIAGTADAFVITTAATVSTLRAACSFFRRRNTSTLAERSPKTPTSWEAATKPGSEKRARIDVGLFMRQLCSRTCTSFKRWRTPGMPHQTRCSHRIGPQNDPLEGAKTQSYILKSPAVIQGEGAQTVYLVGLVYLVYFVA